jgi:hypothetical protein
VAREHSCKPTNIPTPERAQNIRIRKSPWQLLNLLSNGKKNLSNCVQQFRTFPCKGAGRFGKPATHCFDRTALPRLKGQPIIQVVPYILATGFQPFSTKGALLDAPTQTQGNRSCQLPRRSERYETTLLSCNYPDTAKYSSSMPLPRPLGSKVTTNHNNYDTSLYAICDRTLPA